MTTIVTRNANLQDLAQLLQEQQARKLDLVVPAPKMTAQDGHLVIQGTEPIITEDGVTLGDGHYLPTAVGDEGVSAKLGIPLAYVRRLRAEHTELWDHNVNGWLARETGSYLVRTFRPDAEGQAGIMRALLSDRYATMDNLDALMAALQGVEQAGVQVDIKGCDLTERRMTVRVACPEIATMAPTLLKGYRSPFTGASGDENPTVFAGFRITNSETGGGAFTVTPELRIQVCDNGLVINKAAVRAVHLGGKLEESTVAWTEDTQTKAAELIRAKTRDAIASFLNVEWMEAQLRQLEVKAGEEVSTPKQVETVTKGLSFSQEQMDGILGHFIKGGQTTRMGVVNAITSFSQTLPDPDDAFKLESQAVSLLV